MSLKIGDRNQVGRKIEDAVELVFRTGAPRLVDPERADEAEIAKAINLTWRLSGYLLDPHTAVGVVAAWKSEPDRSVPMVVLGTAHPAKFPAAVKAACGIEPKLPDFLADLHERPERFTVLPNDQGAIEAFVRQHSRAAQGEAA